MLQPATIVRFKGVGTDYLGKLISYGDRFIQPEFKAEDHHVGVLYDETQDGDWLIMEATADGCILTPLSAQDPAIIDFWDVAGITSLERRRVIDKLATYKGAPYDYLIFAALGMYLPIASWFGWRKLDPWKIPHFYNNGSYMCYEEADAFDGIVSDEQDWDGGGCPTPYAFTKGRKTWRLVQVFK